MILPIQDSIQVTIIIYTGFAGIKNLKHQIRMNYKFHYELSYHIYVGRIRNYQFKINKRKQGSLGLTEIHRYTTVWGASIHTTSSNYRLFLELEAGDFVSMTMDGRFNCQGQVEVI